ncbi:MAG: hypothetical protein JKZ00_02760 [Flavobacteriaceae bacterium]|nr:hypothetical protein [Flavobacteriaceae bacterium]
MKGKLMAVLSGVKNTTVALNGIKKINASIYLTLLVVNTKNVTQTIIRIVNQLIIIYYTLQRFSLPNIFFRYASANFAAKFCPKILESTMIHLTLISHKKSSFEKEVIPFNLRAL